MRTHHVATAVIGTLIISLAVWALAMWATMELGRVAYENGDYETAERRFETAGRITLFEPWRPAFGQGTALLAQGKTTPGILRLEHALEDVPKADEIDGVKDPNSYECVVRANLYLGYADAGREEEASSVIDSCPNPDPTAVSTDSEEETGEEPAEPSDEVDPQLEELEERNEDSRRQRQDEMEWSGGGGSGQNW
ncbi:hypothetical protein [Flaviflexus huanghaiensis]|uniref:hypothetical protein n=1 Tax=Flaviflexus huanghaiensis TaxID=1111473 RepID=UPI0015F8817A|nr:hypothetical protein [Flaviflexus huanghaiensis]